MNARPQHQTFGNLLKRFRIAAGLTQEELAERASLSAKSISALERGVSRRARKDTAVLLARALGLSAEECSAFESAARSRDTLPATLDSGPPDDGRPALVGRSSELLILERHLRGEGPPVVLVCGEPGMGKTRLLHEASVRARRLGWTVLADGCQRHSSLEPYAPVIGALVSGIQGLVPAQQRSRLEGCSWLVRLLPELLETPGLAEAPSSLPPDQERRLMFAAVARFLANMAGISGTMLVLDDLQWAGVDAIALLGALARSTASMPLRVIAAFRTTEVRPPDPLSTLLADLAHAGQAVRIELGPLGTPEAGALLRSILGGPATQSDEPLDGLTQRLVQRTAGIPFFLVSCGHAVRAGAFDASAGADVPWDVAHAIRQRISTLPDAARDVLGVAAIIGRQVARALLVTATEEMHWSESEVLAALEAACYARLLVERDDDVYEFAHDLIHEITLTDLGAARRAAYHRHIAAVLERESGHVPVEQLAYHYARSGDRSKAAEYLGKAADHAAAMQARAAAEVYYMEMVAQLEALGRPAEAAAAREQLGATQMAAARYSRALDTLEQVAHSYRRAGNTDGLGRTIAQLGWVYALQGTPELGIARITELLEQDIVGDFSTRVQARLHDALAQLYMVRGQYHEQLAAAEQAANFAQQAHDDRLLSQAEMCRGTALLLLGRLREAAQVLESALPSIRSGGDLRDLAFALNNLAVIYRIRGESERAKRHAERALKIAEQLEDAPLMAYLWCHRGEHAYMAGDWSLARKCFARGATLAREVGASWAAPYPLVGLGQLDQAEGRGDDARRQLEEAVLLAERSGDLDALQPAQSALAERELLHGQPAQALARLERLVSLTQQRKGTTTLLLPLLAWAHLDTGNAAQAGTLVTQAIKQARAEQNQIALVDALRIQALVMALAHRAEASLSALEEAIALCRSMGHRYAEVKVHYAALLAATRLGTPERARSSRDAALSLCQRLGERLYAERAAQVGTADA